ncbi:MAG: hypothetical protein ABEJ83_03180 [Candidatus Nanohaloarchaea archaeon]
MDDYFDYDEFQNFDVERFLEESQEQERQRLESELERIKDQLEEREIIHREVIEELNSKKDWYVDQLETLYQRSQGKISGERDRLRNRINEIYREFREEKRSRWRDRQELEKERRELIRRLEELKNEKLSELL